MAHKERWNGLFEVLDVDGNGVLDSNDVALLTKAIAVSHKLPQDDPVAQDISNAYATYIRGLLTHYDANKDGKVSKDEFYNAVNHAHSGTATVESEPDFWTRGAELLFHAIDANKNGAISLDELSKMVKKINPGASDTSITEAYEWAVKEGGTGKLDLSAFKKTIHAWTVEPGPTPHASLILSFFKKW